jgi:hypothetical protein
MASTFCGDAKYAEEITYYSRPTSWEIYHHHYLAWNHFLLKKRTETIPQVIPGTFKFTPQLKLSSYCDSSFRLITSLFTVLMEWLLFSPRTAVTHSQLSVQT